MYFKNVEFYIKFLCIINFRILIAVFKRSYMNYILNSNKNKNMHENFHDLLKKKFNWIISKELYNKIDFIVKSDNNKGI